MNRQFEQVIEVLKRNLNIIKNQNIMFENKLVSNKEGKMATFKVTTYKL